MADYKMLAEMGVPMPPPENLIMDEDLKLVERLKLWSQYMGDGDFSPAPDDIGDAVLSIVLDQSAATITRLHAEIEALKSDVSDLVRAGSDEATI